MTVASAPTRTPAERLKARCGSIVHVPGDPTYDEVRIPWNVTVDQRPAAVATPHSAEQAAEVVRAAAELGLRIAAQGTGHGAAALAQHPLGDALLLRTNELSQVSVDPVAGTARVGSGAIWQQVVDAAAEHGLGTLHGSSPDVGVAGYALGGGTGWYARKLGLACNSITAVELVTADGTLVRADASQRPELFWALRGGGGSFGLVTALELRLFPITDAYAGMMAWDLEQAEPVLRRWADWCEGAPEEVTTSLRMMRFPPIPEIPEFLRGRSLIVLDGAVLGSDELGDELVACFRELGPEIDTFTRMPAAALSRIHLDPEGPTPFVGAGALLPRLDKEAVTALLEAAGPGAQTSLLCVELRQLGGALRRTDPDGGALDRIDAGHMLFCVAMAPAPPMQAQGRADAAALMESMVQWCPGQNYLNFAERSVDPSTGYEPGAWERLCALRRQVDPAGTWMANHQVG